MVVILESKSIWMIRPPVEIVDMRVKNRYGPQCLDPKSLARI